MGFFQMMRIAWRNLWRNGRRTVLALVSIAFGLLLAILLTAMQDRNWADMIELAARLGGGEVTVQHAELRDAPTLDKTVTGTDAIVAAALADPEVERVVVRIVGQALLSTASNSRGAGFVGIDPTEEDSTTLAVINAFAEGAMFSSADDPGIVLGARLAENLGVAGRLDYVGTPGLLVGGSAFRASTGQGRELNGQKVNGGLLVWDLHVDYEARGWDVRALVAGAALQDAADLNQLNGLTGANGIGEQMLGWYVEAGYDVLRGTDSPHQLLPYVRYEEVNTQTQVAPGYAADPARDRSA